MTWRTVLLTAGIVFCVGALGVLILAHLGDEIQADMEKKCDALKGELVFYECLNAGDWFVSEGDRCVNKITGYVCELPDGSEVQFTYDALAGEVRP